ncbi:aspartate-glutamate racemase family [Euphorbia peplus]|nr:aspartate-glutamate racemase family [Euphorbia peplus]
MFKEGMGLLIHKSSNPSLTLGYVGKKNGGKCRTRLNLSVAVKFSSVNVQTDESKSRKEYRKTSSLLKQKNTIGVIGGVSVLSTLIFLEKLVWMSSRAGKESVPFVVCSDPLITRVALTDAETASNISPMVENLRSKRTFLEQSGAGCIVMPCHLSHVWHEEISHGCLLPFFHVGECVASQLKEANLKPIEAGSDVRIGILASSDTFYQEKLQNQGFEVVLPDKQTRDHILIPATEALRRHDMEGAQNLVRIAIHILLMRGVNIVILASDEFQNLLPRADPLLKKCIDPMDALARSTITWATTKHERS